MVNLEQIEKRLEYLEAWVEISKEQMYPSSQGHFEALVKLRVERNRELKEKQLNPSPKPLIRKKIDLE